MEELKKRMSKIKSNVRVGDIMSKEIISLDKNKSVFDAVSVMAEKSISTIIIEEGKKTAGIVTERDLVKKVLLNQKNLKKIKLSEIMTQNPKEIHPASPILIAGNMMKNNKVRKLIVVDESGKVVGIISQTDIINSLNRIYENYTSMFGNPLLSFLVVAVVLIMVALSVVLSILLK